LKRRKTATAANIATGHTRRAFNSHLTSDINGESVQLEREMINY